MQKSVAGEAYLHALREKYLKEMIESSSCILDVGCGPGTLLENFPEIRHERLVGLDPNPNYVSAAKQKFPRAKFLLGDVTTAGSDIVGTFQFGVLLGVLHHLDDAVALKTLRFVWERVVPGGLIVTVDPVILTKQRWLARRLIRGDRGNFVREPSEYMSLITQGNSAVSEFEIRSDLLKVPYDHFISWTRMRPSRT